MNDIIIWEKEKHLGRMILNYSASNPMDKVFFDSLKQIVEQIKNDSNIKMLLIYGTGRHFSSGADLKNLLQTINENVKLDTNGNIINYPKSIMENTEVFNDIYNLKIPVISAIKGVCIGSGLELALCSHIKICCDKAVLGLPETTFNLMPGCTGIARLLEITGKARTMKLVLDGNTIPLEKALEYKIIDIIMPKRNFIENIINFLINKDSSISINQIKESLNDLKIEDEK